MRTVDPFDFLDLTGAFPSVSQARPTYKLATIDPNYVSGDPRVTFDGESTLSLKRYTVLGSYDPLPGERVLMAAVGQANYVIIGSVGLKPAMIARVRKTTVTSLAHNTTVTVDFDEVQVDPYEMWDSGTPERLHVPRDGYYDIYAHASFAVGGGTGNRVINVVTSQGTPEFVRRAAAPTSNTHINSYVLAWYLEAGDWVELRVSQTSGGAINLNTHPNYSPLLAVAYRGKV